MTRLCLLTEQPALARWARLLLLREAAHENEGTVSKNSQGLLLQGLAEGLERALLPCMTFLLAVTN